MKKLLSLTLALLPLLVAGQKLPLYDAPKQSTHDPDVWHVTQPESGKRSIDVFYTSLSEIIEANARQADLQLLPAEAKRQKLHHDSTDYVGGVVYIAATALDRTTMDGSLTVVVLDANRQELLRRALPAGEAELSVSSADFARIYTVPIPRPLPPNSFMMVVDNPALESHEFLIRPVGKHLAVDK